MNSPELETALKIQKFYSRTVTTLGIAIGLILSLYFFSFAMVIDKAPAWVMDFLAITTVLLVLGLLFLKRTAFLITRIVCGLRRENQSMMQKLSASLLDLDGPELAAALNKTMPLTK